MAQIPTLRDDIKALKGLHVWHFALSNCSQRVRMTLEEKCLPWTSHHVSLPDNEHATPEFAAINPAGLVPVLVHDGRTINESNDIIDYIDRTFPEVPLSPESTADHDWQAKATRATDAIQPALKLISHEFLFKPNRRMNEKQLAEFAASCPNPALVAFMRDFSSKEGFGRERISAALQEFVAAFDELEIRLKDHPWIAGQSFGLADISWIVNVHRVMAMRFPLKRWPRLYDWYQRVLARPSFNKAIEAFEDRKVLAFFAAYSLTRKVAGTGVEAYLRSN